MTGKNTTIHARGSALVVSATLRQKIRNVEEQTGMTFTKESAEVTATHIDGRTVTFTVDTAMISGKARDFAKLARSELGLRGRRMDGWSFYIEIPDFNPDYSRGVG